MLCEYSYAAFAEGIRPRVEPDVLARAAAALHRAAAGMTALLETT